MRIPSEPTFLRLIGRAMAACLVVLAIAALAWPPPLQEAADFGNPPNPARSAWFLLWVQELVSHGTAWIYPAILSLAVLAGLPWIPGKGIRITPDDGTPETERAPRTGGLIAILFFGIVVVLTLVAVFCRGKNWEWVSPF
ncbi:MAG TPA: hypothetical protein VGK27_07145 [Candidatus Deferrimicrobiaceae bacterium]